MTELNRRHLFAGAAAATLVPLATVRPASAAAPVSGKQAPGYYRYKVGSFEVTVVSDGGRTFPLADNFVVNAKKDDVNAALAAAFMPKDMMTITFSTIVVNTGSKLVVIDTGNGPAAFEQSKGAVGQMHTNLAVAGIDRGSVDTVIISHFHGDHINGLVTADGRPAFANAEVQVPAAEWKFWTDEANAAKAKGTPIEGNFANVKRVFAALGDKVTRYEADKEIVAGIIAMATPGHTPGHSSQIVTSGNSTLAVQGDITNHPALFVRHPGWHVSYDMDATLAEATRRKFYDRVAAEKILVHGFHFPFPAAGHVEKDGDGYRLVPINWNPVV
jgi:glyoxylase-like metal-dependent hydrolase (beta-lactamase superfamily II)